MGRFSAEPATVLGSKTAMSGFLTWVFELSKQYCKVYAQSLVLFSSTKAKLDLVTQELLIHHWFQLC